MEVLTLMIAVVALVIAVIAFQRTGGIKELRQQVDTLSSRTESVRDRTANILNRFERMVRGKDKTTPEPEKGSEPDQSSKPE